MKLNRRAMIRGAGGASLLLPFLASLPSQNIDGVELLPSAQGSDDVTRRFVAWIDWYGTVPWAWTPKNTSADGRNYEFNTILEPLEPFREKLSILSGITMPSVYKQLGKNSNHGIGNAALLTSAELENKGTPDWFAKGPSLDCLISEQLSSNDRLKGIWCGDNVEHGGSLYTRSNGDSFFSIEYNPINLYDRIFGDFAGDGEQRERIKQGRAGVLDALLPQYNSLRSRLNGGDRQTLEAHMSAIEDLKTRTDRTVSCMIPERPVVENQGGDGSYWGLLGRSAHGEVYKDIIDILAEALICGISRTASFTFGGELVTAKNIVRNIDAINPPNRDLNVHSYSHSQISEVAHTQMWIEICRWKTEMFARFLGKLDAAIEANGKSVLDNSVVLNISEIFAGTHDLFWGQPWGYSNGEDHQYADPAVRPKGLPIVVAGTAGGKLKTGRHHDFWTNQISPFADGLGKYSHGELLRTLGRAVGLSTDTISNFGMADVCTRFVDEIVETE